MKFGQWVTKEFLWDKKKKTKNVYAVKLKSHKCMYHGIYKSKN